jgi:long-chain acyl-CoA synthetase
MLAAVAGQYGDKIAIVSGGRRVSYAHLEEASNRIANALIKMGVNRGDRIALLLSNSAEFAITFFGIIKIGAIAVPLDTKFKNAEITSLFNDFQPKVLVTESPTLDSLVPVLHRFQSIKHVIDLSTKPHSQFLTYQGLLKSNPADKIKIEPGPEDVALIIYTSGPAFLPRGIMLTYGSIATEALISGDGFEQTDKDIVPLFALPMHHAAGLIIVLLTSFIKGSTVVMLPGVSISTLLETIEKERCTLLIGVPFIFSMMINFAEQEGIHYDLSSLCLCAAGGSALPVDVSRQFKQLYGMHIAQFWGLTEATAHITTQPVDGSGVLGSVGKPLRGCEVKIVDPNNQVLPPNQSGEVVASQAPLMKGYYNNSEVTAEVLKGNWLYTGDIGKLDKEGNLYITGRKKDLIIIKGQNVWPSDIEGMLYKLPMVAEVAAIGIPDELRGEVVGVAIRLNKGETATEQEIKRFCLDRLANYKVPKQVFFVDSFPITAGGKIDKEALRQRLGILPIFQETAIH